MDSKYLLDPVIDLLVAHSQLTSKFSEYVYSRGLWSSLETFLRNQDPFPGSTELLQLILADVRISMILQVFVDLVPFCPSSLIFEMQEFDRSYDFDFGINLNSSL